MPGGVDVDSDHLTEWIVLDSDVYRFAYDRSRFSSKALGFYDNILNDDGKGSGYRIVEVIEPRDLPIEWSGPTFIVLRKEPADKD